MAPRPLRRLLAATLVVYWLTIFTLTHLPLQHLPHIKLSDKYEHLLAYGGLGGLLMLTLWAYRPMWRQSAVIVLAIGMIYGALDEQLQRLPFVNRTCDFL